MFGVSSWDLVGALPVPLDAVKDRVGGGDFRWVNRGGVDMLGANPTAATSAFGLPRAKALYGSLPEQLKDPESFASRLRGLLAARKKYRLAEGELLARCADPYEYMERRADGTFMPEVFRRLGWPPEGHASAPANRADIERVVDHIAHVAKLVGADHVGIGTDYESGDVPNGLEHAGKLPNLTAALLRRGFSEQEIRKILIDNFKRVYRPVLDRA